MEAQQHKRFLPVTVTVVIGLIAYLLFGSWLLAGSTRHIWVLRKIQIPVQNAIYHRAELECSHHPPKEIFYDPPFYLMASHEQGILELLEDDADRSSLFALTHAAIAAIGLVGLGAI